MSKFSSGKLKAHVNHSYSVQPMMGFGEGCGGLAGFGGIFHLYFKYLCQPLVFDPLSCASVVWTVHEKTNIWPQNIMWKK